jgi:hypothetical protein
MDHTTNMKFVQQNLETNIFVLLRPGPVWNVASWILALGYWPLDTGSQLRLIN